VFESLQPRGVAALKAYRVRHVDPVAASLPTRVVDRSVSLKFDAAHAVSIRPSSPPSRQ
jgi:hypothetical protein